jgi:hypothetical protein
MRRSPLRARPLLAPVLLLVGCVGLPTDSGEGREPIAGAQEALSPAQRRARAAQIRDAAAARGITQGWLLAGIADAETGMSHCWSELTWACMGPSSPDCGGGPVVAGAGDGPCSAMQGGLGMFQFDAGTYADTLRREGDRILTIAGNVDAAVDFVLRMVIRSVYIDGVDDEAQAIAWLNGVRVDGDRFAPWIQTVTHYYNGCTPTGCSVYATRRAHYERNARNVYAEMGADFWETRPAFRAVFVSQSFPLASAPFELRPLEEVAGDLRLRNEGTRTWVPGEVLLGTTEPRDGPSALAGPDWISPSRAATVEAETPPGAVGRFAFTVRAPRTPGDYPQFFNLVREGEAWFSDSGGPPDRQLQIRVTVLDAPPVEPDAGAPDAAAADAGPAADAAAVDGPAAGEDASDRRPRASAVEGGCGVSPAGSALGGPERSRRAPGALAVFVSFALVAARAGRARRRP